MMTRRGRTNRIARLLEDRRARALQKSDYFKEVLIRLQYEGKASLGKNLRRAKEMLRFFQEEIGEHMKEEEKTLFPFLEGHFPRLEPLISLLRSEHQDFKKNTACLKLLLNDLEEEKNDSDRARIIERLRETGMYLVYLLRGHLQEESEILYKAADHGLKADEKKELVRQMGLAGIQRR